MQSASPTASLLASEIRRIAGSLKRQMREHGGRHELTPSQTAVLVRLEGSGPATVATLARAEGVRHQSMRAVIASLQTAGLVRGTADPSDGRQTLLSLTPRCLKWFREGRAARQDWLTGQISQKLSAREQEGLRAGLALLARLVED